MAEKLRIDGTFGYGAAVNGKVFLTTARRVVVNHSWNDFLSHTTLANDEHAQIGRRHLQGDVQHMIQGIAVAYDVIPLLDSL